jgi:hypothetical protein
MMTSLKEPLNFAQAFMGLQMLRNARARKERCQKNGTDSAPIFDR